MHISEIMVVDPVTVQGGAVVSEAVRLMDEHRIRHLPVVHDDVLVGVLSDRDLLEPAIELVPSAGKEGELQPALVRNVMCPGPLSVSPEASFAEAARVLCKWGIGCLPVTRKGDVLVGFVTETDLLDAFVGSNLYGSLDDSKNPPVEECMSPGPMTISSDASLQIALELMRSGNFRHLPITDHSGKLVGIVSDRDLRQAIGKGSKPRTTALSIGSSNPSTTLVGETIARAANRMIHERIGAQPVLDAQDELVGILTSTDVLEHIANVLA